MMPSPLQQQYLELMGISVWQQRQAAVQSPATGRAVATAVQRPALSSTDSVAWQKLREQVAACTRCDLHCERTQTVFGTGARNADWMIIGEAPGADEDRQGEPFVGRAGKLLNAMLEAIGLQREQVYIANLLKCRPPKNRDPRPEEVAHCENYLQRQIELLQPKIILAVGRIAAQNLLQVATPIGRLRGQPYQYPGSDIPLVVSYHPAYLLRSPQEKPKAWQDLQLAMRIYTNS